MGDVVIDLCVACDAVLLDPGELRRLAALHKPSGLGPAAAGSASSAPLTQTKVPMLDTRRSDNRDEALTRFVHALCHLVVY